MALRRFNAGGKKQKELTDEQKQESWAVELSSWLGCGKHSWDHFRKSGKNWECCWNTFRHCHQKKEIKEAFDLFDTDGSGGYVRFQFSRCVFAVFGYFH